MTVTVHDAGTGAPPGIRRGTGIVALVAALAGVVTASTICQLRRGTIPDTSWGITMAERVLGGARLYIDLIETNPPMTVWLHLPPVALARWMGLPAEPFVLAWATLAVLLGLGLALLIARRAALPEFPSLLALSPVLLAILLLLPGNSFAEREHFGAVLLLPLLVMQAWRADGGRPSFGIVLSAALAGSLIVLVKPYFAVAILAPALAVAWQRRSLAELLRAEYWIIGTVCAAYLATVRIFYPAFLAEIYPMLSDTYLRIHADPSRFTYYLLLFAFLGAVFLLLRPRTGFGALPVMIVTAATASLLPLLYQGKAWPYHALPALLLMAVALVCLRARDDDGGNKLNWRDLLAALAVAACTLRFLYQETPAPELVAAIRNARPDASVELIGMDIASGHPLTRMGGGHWLSAYCSDWLGGMALVLAERARAAGDLAGRAHYDALASTYFAGKAAGFRRDRPDVVIVETNDSPLWNKALAAAGFDALLGDYRLAAQTADLKVMVRKE